MEEVNEYQLSRIKENNFSLILKSYDDIFSIFDPRLFNSRALSDDFLAECKRAVRDKESGIELRLFVPKNKRSYLEEIKIKRRLKEHFHKHFREKQNEIKKIKLVGFFWFVLGVAVMIGESFLILYSGFISNLLKIILMPAGWFFFWEGLGKVFIYSKEKKPDYNFYKKMANVEITFLHY
jgi:hypothetical protein